MGARFAKECKILYGMQDLLRGARFAKGCKIC